ncbi:MAG: hypothetical protein JXA16_09235, partial [Bacteroidales bacterium]|nr:hypothetical protein [Bacteroidales bacterium]
MKTKSLLLSPIFIFIILNHSFSQNNSGIIRYFEVKSDKNITLEEGPNYSVSKSDKCYIVDGNESKGYVELDFDVPNFYNNPKSISLIINSADVEYAESSGGFSVFYNNTKVGNISQVYRNAKIEISIDNNILKSAKKINLVIKANNDDGLYLLSKKSGF